MKVLFLATDYPYVDYPASGVYNERCVRVLKEHCEAVEVLVPRPLTPPLVSRFRSRWNNYSRMRGYEVRNGIPVHRPRYLQIPGINPAFWLDPGTFLWCRNYAARLHRRVGFDAILAFGLVSGLAWRLGRHLGIPAIGWAIGVIDVSAPLESTRGRSLAQALRNLDLVFYQSRQLRSCAAAQLQVAESELMNDRHVVLPHGIPSPPALPPPEIRADLRKEWGVGENETVALFIGRIVRDKGVFDLVEAVRIARRQGHPLTSILIGSFPGFDDTAEVEALLQQDRTLEAHVKILPSCHPDQVWDYLSAADVFAFPSYEEGMPNALLEAMAMSIPSVAYDIPPVVELEGGSGGIILTPTGNVEKLAEGLVGLSIAANERDLRGRRARARAHERFMVDRNIPEAVTRIEKMIGKQSFADLSPCESAQFPARRSSWQP